MSDDDFYRVPKWHAPHPHMPDRPRCGTLNSRGNPTHRIAKSVPVTCEKCKRAMGRAGGGTP